MELSFVIAVALAVSIMLVFLLLVAVIVYQRWRICDNNAHLKAFLHENLELRDKLRAYEEMINLL